MSRALLRLVGFEPLCHLLTNRSLTPWLSKHFSASTIAVSETYCPISQGLLFRLYHLDNGVYSATVYTIELRHRHCAALSVKRRFFLNQTGLPALQAFVTPIHDTPCPHGLGHRHGLRHSVRPHIKSKFYLLFQEPLQQGIAAKHLLVA